MKCGTSNRFRKGSQRIWEGESEGKDVGPFETVVDQLSINLFVISVYLDAERSWRPTTVKLVECSWSMRDWKGSSRNHHHQIYILISVMAYTVYSSTKIPLVKIVLDCFPIKCIILFADTFWNRNVNHTRLKYKCRFLILLCFLLHFNKILELFFQKRSDHLAVRRKESNSIWLSIIKKNLEDIPSPQKRMKPLTKE